MKTISRLRTSIHLSIVGLVSLLLSGCGEKYELLGHGDPLILETTGITVEKLCDGYYGGKISSEGTTFSFKITEPYCSWLAVSGYVNDRDSFFWEENEESLTKEWGTLRYVSKAHPIEFDVMICPNTTNEERVINIEMNYMNSFGKLIITQLAD